jgi:hypothetical protein
MTYQDVLSCPTYERRFFLQMLINEANKKNELAEEQAQERRVSNSGGKGSRTTRISGNQLKAQLQSGQIPND